MRTTSLGRALVLASLIAGCGRSSLVIQPTPVDAASGFDTARDAGPVDAARDTSVRDGGPDAPSRCTTDGDCADGSFCNGTERCAMGLCVSGDPVVCTSDRCFEAFCDEDLRDCNLNPRDNDGDSFPSIECGGADCDDGNPLVSPSAMEVCVGDVDDDCDAVSDCADTDCAFAAECMTGSCPDRDVGSSLGEIARGTTTGTGVEFAGSCGGATAPELAFRWVAPTSGLYVFDTRGSAFDTLLYVRAGSCIGRELACDDDAGGGNASLVRLPLAAGDAVILFVDGFGMGVGNFVLNVTIETTAEICTNGTDDDSDMRVDCDDPDCAAAPSCCRPLPEDCGNGGDDDCDSAIDCSDPDCVSAPACCMPMPESCGNGLDDDCDRIVDCADSDCETLPVCCVPAPEDCTNGRDDDCNALTDCADSACTAAPACCALRTESCTNMVDDDCDGRIDCMDEGCTIDPVCAPTCPSNDLGNRTGPMLATGTTVDQGNDQTTTCGGRGRGPDVTYGWVAPRTATYVFDTAGSTHDTVLHLRANDCSGMELACDDDSGDGVTSRITRTITAGTRIVIIVDSFSPVGGAFVLNIRPVMNETGRCVDGIDNDGDGFIDCVDSDCTSDASCCVPVPEMCGDMIDNDCDRVVDCADPNCRTSASCCTPSLEVCDNFGDDDCDGFVDCVDADCAGRPPC
jgi:hypothetical protein